MVRRGPQSKPRVCVRAEQRRQKCDSQALCELLMLLRRFLFRLLLCLGELVKVRCDGYVTCVGLVGCDDVFVFQPQSRQQRKAHHHQLHVITDAEVTHVKVDHGGAGSREHVRPEHACTGSRVCAHGGPGHGAQAAARQRLRRAQTAHPGQGGGTPATGRSDG